MKNILEIQNLKYKDILDIESLNLEKNTFNILIGPNSSGKTTLVRCIFGLVKYEGNIKIFDKLSTSKNIKKLRKDIAVISDNNKLLNETVMYNIMFPLLNMGYLEDAAKEMVYEISKKLGISKLLLKHINDLSTSEKKMVSISASLVTQPKFIIIDDYLDELDRCNKDKIINYLKKLKCTILFISNNEEDILLSDNIILINKGKIVYYGNLIEALENEKLFSKNNIKMPFSADLSHKLKTYDVIDKIYLDIDKMVDEVWK